MFFFVSQRDNEAEIPINSNVNVNTVGEEHPEPPTMPMHQPIQASRMRKVMLDKANHAFDVIINRVNELAAIRHAPRSESTQELFINFMSSKIPSLSEAEQSDFIDGVMAAYLNTKNKNFN